MIGHVKWQVYTAYMKAVGVGMVVLVLLSLALMQVSSYDCPVDSVLLSLDLSQTLQIRSLCKFDSVSVSASIRAPASACSRTLWLSLAPVMRTCCCMFGVGFPRIFRAECRYAENCIPVYLFIHALTGHLVLHLSLLQIC